jgi:CheY-like chemotaxis protein
MLQALGHAVDVATNGHEVVACAESGAFDAILMDCQMPEMDGLDATRRIRSGDACPEIPIIALSANVFESDRLACAQAGMDGFLGKPLHMDDLKRCLNHVAMHGHPRQD